MTANTSVGQPLCERITESARDVRSILKHEANALRTPVHRVLLAEWGALLREAAEALRNAEKDAKRLDWIEEDAFTWDSGEYFLDAVIPICSSDVDMTLRQAIDAALSTAKADD